MVGFPTSLNISPKQMCVCMCLCVCVCVCECVCERERERESARASMHAPRMFKAVLPGLISGVCLTDTQVGKEDV